MLGVFTLYRLKCFLIQRPFRKSEGEHVKKAGSSLQISVDVIHRTDHRSLHLAEGLDSLHGCASVYTCMFLSSLDIHSYRLPHVKAEVDPCL